MEFVDTNILIYAHDPNSAGKQAVAIELLSSLQDANVGAVSIQVLTEFYSVALRLGMDPQVAESVVADFRIWRIHTPHLAHLLKAAGLQRQFQLSWWDALILNSATELGCETLWTEDFAHGQQYGPVTARNPFR